MNRLPQHNFPKRKYCEGEKKMYSMRLPIKLTSKLEEIAKKEGTTVTEIAQIALDEWLQWASTHLK